MLSDTGSNVYVQNLCRALVHEGHEVHLLCQEPEPLSYDFVANSAVVDEDRIEKQGEQETPYPGRCFVYLPKIGDLLPVYVYDDYPGWQVKTFLELTNEEFENYVGKNISAVRTVVKASGPEAAVTNHAVPGPLIAAHANKPKVRQQEIEPLDAAQARAFLDAARGDRFEALYALCLTAGLRQGEALGLKWSDIDLSGATGTLRVNRQLRRVRRDGEKSGKLEFSEPKNASRRTVGLPTRAIGALRSHRKRQLEEKLKAGPEWRDNGLVFASMHGAPLDAQNIVNRSFKPLLSRAGLPGIRFHDLRHSCLSLLAQRGEPIRDLQALAGHATAAFTLQRYTHHYDASARRTADAMGEILPEGASPDEP